MVAPCPAVHGLGSEISARRSASTVLSLHERPGNPAELPQTSSCQLGSLLGDELGDQVRLHRCERIDDLGVELRS